MSGETGRQYSTSDARVTCSFRPISTLSCGRPRCIILLLLEQAARAQQLDFCQLFDIYVNVLAMADGHLNPSYCLTLATSTAYAETHYHQDTKESRGIALLACDLL